MSSPSWKAAMVQFLYRCWIFSNFLLLATNIETADAIECHFLEPNQTIDVWNNCSFDHRFGIGKTGEFIVLDFSKNTQKEINEFFKKADKPATLIAGIRIVGNKDLETLNFGKIDKWTPSSIPRDARAVDIRNNLKLETIIWEVEEFVPSVKESGNNPQNFFYNNPLFEESKNQLQIIRDRSDKTSYIQEKKHECRFQDPLNATLYNAPSQEFLDLCHIIKGDLKLENLKITGDLKLADNGTCVHLVNVDVKDGEITMPGADQGQLQCKISGIKSRIKENPGLCYEKMDKVANYFPEEIRDYGFIAIHEDSCATTCDSRKAFHKYTLCKAITGDIDISQWFTNPAMKTKKYKLESADGVLSIKNSQLTTLDLLQLASAGGLEIINNKHLETLKLGQLQTVETLTITGNPLLTVDKFQGLRLMVKGSSTVECHSSAATPVTDAAALRLCTHIKGDLILSGLKSDIKPSDAPIKEVEGCLTVEKTELTNLDFLSGTTFKCQGEHKAVDNGKLCLPKFIKMTVTGAVRKEKCGKTCYSLSEGNCVIFSGDLTIDTNTPAAQLKELTTIQGSLKIDGTNHVNLNFPKLEEISSPKAPALDVSNNAKLETIKMPKISKITVADGRMPIINILDNPKLKDVDFVPSSQRDSCKDPNAAACIYAGANKNVHKTEGDSKDSNLLMIVAWCVAGLLGLVICIGVVVICRKKLKAILIKKKLTPLVSTVFYWIDEYANGTEMTAPQMLTLTAIITGVTSQAEMSTLRQELRASKKSHPNPTLDKNIHYTSLDVQQYMKPFFDLVNKARKRIAFFYMQQTDFANMIPPVNLCTHEILHFGTGYQKNFKQTAKMDVDDDADFQTVRMEKRPAKPATNEYAKSQQISMEYPQLHIEGRANEMEGYFEDDDKRCRVVQKIETEVTEILLPETVPGHFEDLVKIPWYQLIGMAYENNLMIHTNKPEYFMLIYLLMNTYAELQKSYGLVYRQEMENHYEQMYLLFRTAFTEDGTYPMDVYFLWIYLTIELFVKQKEKDEWYTATLKQLEGVPQNLDVVKKLAGQLDRLKSTMGEIYEMNKLIGNAKDGEKISLGKTAKGDDVIEIVHKKEPKMELARFCTTNMLLGNTLPIYKPSSNWPADLFFRRCICEKPGTSKLLVYNLKFRRERITQLMTQPKRKKSASLPISGPSAPVEQPAAPPAEQPAAPPAAPPEQPAAPPAAAPAEEKKKKKKKAPRKPPDNWDCVTMTESSFKRLQRESAEWEAWEAARLRESKPTSERRKDEMVRTAKVATHHTSKEQK